MRALRKKGPGANEKKIKYYSAVCNPDLTEGRGYHTSVYIAVLDNDYVSLQRALKLMIDTYGSPIAYVQGCSAVPNWSVPSVCTKEAFDMAMPTKVGDYHGRVQKIFISQTKVPGMPDPIWVE